jgi:hypothetical protein
MAKKTKKFPSHGKMALAVISEVGHISPRRSLVSKSLAKTLFEDGPATYDELCERTSSFLRKLFNSKKLSGFERMANQNRYQFEFMEDGGLGPEDGGPSLIEITVDAPSKEIEIRHGIASTGVKQHDPKGSLCRSIIEHLAVYGADNQFAIELYSDFPIPYCNTKGNPRDATMDQTAVANHLLDVFERGNVVRCAQFTDARKHGMEDEFWICWREETDEKLSFVVYQSIQPEVILAHAEEIDAKAEMQSEGGGVKPGSKTKTIKDRTDTL